MDSETACSRTGELRNDGNLLDWKWRVYEEKISEQFKEIEILKAKLADQVNYQNQLQQEIARLNQLVSYLNGLVSYLTYGNISLPQGSHDHVSEETVRLTMSTMEAGEGNRCGRGCPDSGDGRETKLIGRENAQAAAVTVRMNVPVEEVLIVDLTTDSSDSENADVENRQSCQVSRPQSSLDHVSKETVRWTMSTVDADEGNRREQGCPDLEFGCVISRENAQAAADAVQMEEEDGRSVEAGRDEDEQRESNAPVEEVVRVDSTTDFWDSEDADAENQESLQGTQSIACLWVAWVKGDGHKKCGKVFKSGVELVSHLQSEHRKASNRGSFVCLWEGCKRKRASFPNVHRLVAHFKTHSCEKPFRCRHEGCGRLFSSKQRLYCHMFTHKTKTVRGSTTATREVEGKLRLSIHESVML